MIYWVAVEELPTKKEQDEENALSKLILEPTAIIARDEQDAALRVALDNPKITNINKDKLKVVVRPF